MEKEIRKTAEKAEEEKTLEPGDFHADKKKLRKKLRQVRDAMSADDREKADRMILDRLFSQKEFRTAAWVYTFVSFGSEPDTRRLIRYCLQEGVFIAVPRIEEKEMNFYRIRSWDDLVPGIWGIPEPKAGTELAVDPGFMLVPGLAFDRKGYRLGYGGGYYDRYLAGHPGFYTMGAAYARQIVDPLPTGPYDLPVDRILTEKEMIIPY